MHTTHTLTQRPHRNTHVHLGTHTHTHIDTRRRPVCSDFQTQVWVPRTRQSISVPIRRRREPAANGQRNSHPVDTTLNDDDALMERLHILIIRCNSPATVDPPARACSWYYCFRASFLVFIANVIFITVFSLFFSNTVAKTTFLLLPLLGRVTRASTFPSLSIGAAQLLF